MKLADIFILLIILDVIFSLVGSYKNLDKSNGDATSTLTREITQCLKGILAVGILIFHLIPYVDKGPIISAFGDSGYLIVAAFFFLSGYGLQKRVIETSGQYVNVFLIKREVSTIIPFINVSIVYCIYYLFSKQKDVIFKNLESRENGHLIVTHAWFVLAICIFYVLFYLSSKYFQSAAPYVLFAELIIYIVLAKLGVGAWWYYSCLSFGIGVVFGNNEKHILKKRKITFIISLMIFVFAYMLRLVNGKYLGLMLLYIISHLLASSAFAVLVYLIAIKIRLVNRQFLFLGKISYEIYLIHIMIYDAFRLLLPTFNGFLFCVISFGLIFIISYCIQSIDKKVINSLMKNHK